jgi:hypothetical protein
MTRNDMNEGNARMDHSLSTKDQIFGSYSFEDRPHVAPGLQFLQGGTYPLRNMLLAITETRIFTPTVVNEGRFGYNRTKTFLQGLGAFTSNYSKNVFGWNNTSPNPFDFGLPDASITSFSGIGSSSESIGANDSDYQFVDNLSIVNGAHNLKMGVSLIHEKFYQITDFSGVPSFGFTGNYTGVGMGDFLLGDAYTLRTAVGDSHQNLRSNYWAGYLQDNWRVRPSLTLNLGVRYEHAQTPHDTEDRTGWFDPQVSQWITSESGGVRNGIFDPQWNNFAPRVGFAYSPKFLPNTVIRSAYGVFYATDNWNELQFEVIGPAYYSTATLTNTLPLPTYNLENIFPSLAPSSNTSLTPFSVDKRSRSPYVQEWNFGIQHTLAKDWLVDVAYVGDEGLKLPVREDENYPKSDPTGTVAYASRVPFPGFGYILFDHDAGWSSYNGLQVKVEHRFTNGLYFLGTYTWSHAIDYATTDESQSYSGINALSKGNGTYDERQRVVASFTYELPMGHGKHFASGTTGAVDRLISGWKVNGIPTFDTGEYATPTLPQNWTNNGSYGINRPNKIGNEVPANRTYTDWLNIGAYAYPGCSTYIYANCNGTPGALHISGNAARDSIRVPGVNDWDLAIMKDTRVTESKTVQFRAEFFNAFNHVQFSSPGTSINPASFGIISGLLIPARQIQFGLKLLW